MESIRISRWTMLRMPLLPEVTRSWMQPYSISARRSGKTRGLFQRLRRIRIRCSGTTNSQLRSVAPSVRLTQILDDSNFDPGRNGRFRFEDYALTGAAVHHDADWFLELQVADAAVLFHGRLFH